MFRNIYNFLHKKELKRSDIIIFSTMLVGALLALFASFNLTLDKFMILQDPDTALNCSINIVLNCATVMESWQSSLLGFPNMIIGLMAYPIIITVAVLGLLGVKFPRSFVIAASIGYLLSALFSFWLFFESLYAIQVLCPWCLLVTFSETLILASITYYVLRENTYRLSKKADVKVQAFLKAGYFPMIVVSWIVLLFALIFLKFGAALFS